MKQHLMHWTHQAACKGLDPSMFFPKTGEMNVLRAAQSVCKTCSVKQNCLNDNLYEEFGVWGGTSERERRAIRRQRKGA